MKAAEHAQMCYGDYIQNDYVYQAAYSAAHAVARGGMDAARTAAIAAHQRAITDVKYASDYKDARVADAYLHVASGHDYYATDTQADADDADDFDGDSGHDTTSLSYVDGLESIDDTDDTRSDEGAGVANSIDPNDIKDAENGTDHNELAAACNAPLDNDDF